MEESLYAKEFVLVVVVEFRVLFEEVVSFMNCNERLVGDLVVVAYKSSFIFRGKIGNSRNGRKESFFVKRKE